MTKNYFITGATGFVGRFLLKRLLVQNPSCHVHVLIRKDRGRSGSERLVMLMKQLFTPEEVESKIMRTHAIEGDVTKYRFGLSPEQYDRLTKKIEIVFHSAASIRFNLELSDALDINTEGTHQIISLAADCMMNGQLENIYHISTAYVIGRKNSTQEARIFANTYENAKYESELVLNRFIAKGFPITIFRPSIISGDAHTGEITSNNIIYKFLAMLSRQSLTTLPGPTSLNIIPLNNYLDTMFEIIKRPDCIGKTFNITNPRNVSFTDLINYACETLSVRAPVFIPVGSKHMLPGKTLHHIAPFMSYFEDEHFFDLSNTYAILGQTEIPCDDVIQSMKNIVDYCYKKRLLREVSSVAIK